MRALLSDTAGPADMLRFGELPDPVPGAGQILVRVAAVSLNFPDALMIEDLYQFKPQRPFAPGGEVAGVIVAVGPNVSGFSVGDRVCSLCGHGGLQELVAADAWRTFAIPDAMPFDVAATMIMTYGTSLHTLVDRTPIAAGDDLLVLGAAGGVGLSAVELGKILGARVVAGVSSSEKGEIVRAAGADEVIVYPRGPLDRQASRELACRFKAASTDGYRVICDPVGGDYAEPALRSIGWEGHYGVVGFSAGIPQIALNLALLKACSIVGVFWGAWASRDHVRFHDEMAMLFDFWRDGRLKPTISRRYLFAEACEAIARLHAREAVGKLVVTLD